MEDDVRCCRCGRKVASWRRSEVTGKPVCRNDRDPAASCWHIEVNGGQVPDITDRLLAAYGKLESDDGYGHDWVPDRLAADAADEIRALRERLAAAEAGGSPEVRELDALRRSNVDVLARMTEAARELGSVAEDLGGVVYQAVCTDTLKSVAIAAGLDWTVESTRILEGLGALVADLRAEVEQLRAAAQSRSAVGRIGHSEAVAVHPPYRLGDSDGTAFGWDGGGLHDVLRRAAGVDPGGPLDGDVAAAWGLCEALERRLGQVDVGPDLRTGDRVLVVDLFGSFFHALRATLVNVAARREAERRGSDG